MNNNWKKNLSLGGKWMGGILCALMMLTFTACGDDSEEIVPDVSKGKYAFAEPCMKWGGNETEVRDYMKPMSEWKESAEQIVDNRIDFVNKKTQAQISYTFREGKLVESSVTYFSCNDKFEQMKSEWGQKLNLTWQENSAFGHVFYIANCQDRQCRVNVQKGSNMGIDYMSADFEYSEFFW